MASTLHYLTVQDVLWINLQATKKVHHFNYARLEEATYYQYAYGDSNSLLSQATRFVNGFLKMHPLEGGNGATAFVALIAFLRMNGRCVDLMDTAAESWFRKLAVNPRQTRETLDDVVHVVGEIHHETKPDVRACIQSTLSDFPETVAALANEPS